MRTLVVFRDGELVGHLREQDEAYEFEYAGAYLAGQSLPISASLPPDPALHRGSRVRAFFGNLLPEGEIRAALARQFKLDASDDLGLLGHIGADCAGALVILREGEQPLAEDRPFEKRYAAIEDAVEFGQLLEALAASHVANFRGVPTRLSLAGAQDKTAIVRFGGTKLYRSLGGATTNIVKLGGRLDAQGQAIFEGIVQNELFCCRLAEACGIAIRPVEALPYRRFRDGPIEHVFCIERFDRVVDHAARQVRRIHQEDFCQALGRPRTQKYEAEAGISLADMFRFASDPDQVTTPAVARKQLLDLVLFNLVIGNRDSHAKNYSLLRQGRKAELAPAYDLVCTEFYQNVDRSLPQKIGEAEMAENITPADLDKLAEQIELRPAVLRRELGRMCGRVRKQCLPTFAEVRELPGTAHADKLIADMLAIIQKNADMLSVLAESKGAPSGKAQLTPTEVRDKY